MQPQELQAWFDHVRDVLEDAYTQHPDDEPWRQSGMSGPYERWELLRKPVANCVDRSGAFLDIGCANGYFLACLLKWTGERGLSVEPYGLDISPRLLELAKKRLPDYRTNLFQGNSFYWQPPRRFDFVRTELVYVPAGYERRYVDRLLAEFLAPGGKLLVCNYMEGDPNPMRGLLPGCHPTRFLADRLAELGLKAGGYCDGFDPVRDRRVRVAVLTNPQPPLRTTG